MTEYDQESAAIPDTKLRDDLPPVQPPSAGFIVQLFVFPALIVMGVVAIWWMFGLIAAGDQDWHKLLQDLQSQNLHVRNRAMYGLAQVLEQDSRRGSQGQHLCENREIAQGLTDQLLLELRRNSTSSEGVAIQQYLLIALGMMDAGDVTIPAFLMAMEPQRDVKIRQGAAASLAIVAGRAREHGTTLSSQQSIDGLIQLSTDSLPVLRQSAAFALGLFDSPDATHQLEVLMGDGDEMTRVNAAIGLARHGSTAGFTIFRDAIKLPESMPADDPSLSKKSSNEKPATVGQQLSVTEDQFLIVKNVLKAVRDLASKFTSEQRSELVPRIETLSAKHPEIRIRIDAENALNSLKASGVNAPGT